MTGNQIIAIIIAVGLVATLAPMLFPELPEEQVWGMMVAIGVFGLFAWLAWISINTADARAKLVDEIRASPASFIFSIFGVLSVCTFFAGIALGSNQVTLYGLVSAILFAAVWMFGGRRGR